MHLYRLACALARAGHDVHLIGNPAPGDLMNIANTRFIFHRVRAPTFSFGEGFFGWFRNFFIASISVTASVLTVGRQRYSFDVIHGHDAISSLLILRLRKVLFRNTPFIFTLHATAVCPSQISYKGLQFLVMRVSLVLIRSVLRLADHTVVFSNARLDDVVRCCSANPSKVSVTRQISDPTISLHPEDELANARRKLNIPSDYCIYVGRLSSVKGVPELLQALVGTDIHCVLVGGGPLGEGLKELARSLRLENRVTFTGIISQEELEKLYQGAQFLVLPSHAEGFPMVILEALSYGIPVISTSVAGISEAIRDDYNGYVVQPGDVNALRLRINELSTDLCLRQRLKINARKTIQESFDSQGLIRTMERIYLRGKHS